MFRNPNPTRLRIIGALLDIAGGGLYLGLLEVFEGHSISFLMTGTLGWLTVAGYSAIGLALIGAGLLLTSFVARRP